MRMEISWGRRNTLNVAKMLWSKAWLQWRSVSQHLSRWCLGSVRLSSVTMVTTAPCWWISSWWVWNGWFYRENDDEMNGIWGYPNVETNTILGRDHNISQQNIVGWMTIQTSSIRFVFGKSAQGILTPHNSQLSLGTYPYCIQKPYR